MSANHAVAATQAIDPSSIVYSALVTTQSDSTATYSILKGSYAAAGLSITVTGTLDIDGITPLPNTQMYAGVMGVPYYLSNSEPLSTPWQGACTSGFTVGLLNSAFPALVTGATEGPNHTTCQAASGGALGDYDFDDGTLTAFNAGFFDAAGNVIDESERHVTRYNPIPQFRSLELVDVQISVPTTGAAPLGGWACGNSDSRHHQ